MRNGIDTVEISRIEKLLADLDEEGLRRFFSAEELGDAGSGPARAQKLAARFAAKEACCKLFPKEICLGTIEPHDFALSRDGYGQPHVVPSERARAVMNRHRVASISVSTTHTDASATAVATVEPATMAVPWYGKLIYHVLPLRRRVVMENLRRVYGDTLAEKRIVEIAQAFYAHLVKFLGEFVRLAFMGDEGKRKLVRIEGLENLVAARDQGKGVLLLAGHFGNWEVSTVAGMSQFKQYRGHLHFIRRPLKPQWFNDLVMRRFQKAGFGTLEKSGSLDEILALLDGKIDVEERGTIRRCVVAVADPPQLDRGRGRCGPVPATMRVRLVLLDGIEQGGHVGTPLVERLDGAEQLLAVGHRPQEQQHHRAQHREI